jgi:AcrR family transcriptional regulator
MIRRRILGQHNQEANTHEFEASRRQERAERILDAAAALLLRWGYHKMTLDDISREAGVAKATIYLHWKTREELFGALIKREKLEMAEEIRQRIIADAAGATLGGILKHSALALMKRPLMKAVLLRDMDVLGKLAQSPHSKAAYMERMEGFKIYLELLREHDLVRTDLSLRSQVYLFCAIFVGFFLVAPLMPAEFTLADEELAELMAEAAHCTLEPARAAPSEALETASHAFLEYLDRRTAAAQTAFEDA